MAKIDQHSLTWKQVLRFMEQQRAEAIEMLRAGSNSDKQRGRLDLLDELEKLPQQAEPERVTTDTYLT